MNKFSFSFLSNDWSEHRDSSIIHLSFLINLIRLTNNKNTRITELHCYWVSLISQKFTNVHLCFLGHVWWSSYSTDVLSKHNMVANGLACWLADFVTWKFLGMVEDDVILIQFVCQTISLVKENRVTKMNNWGIITLEIFVHNSFIDYDLLSWTQISDRIIKFKCFNKLLLGSSVALVGFKERSTASSGLHYFHSKMLDMIIVHSFVVCNVSRLKIVVTSNVDSAFCSLFIFFFIVFSWQLKESSTWFLL